MFELGNIGGYFKSGMDTIGSGLADVGRGALGLIESDKAKKNRELYEKQKEADLYSDENLGYLADMEDEAGGAVKAGLGTGEEALKKAQDERTPWDFDKMAKILRSVSSGDEGPQVQQASARAGGFRYDPKPYENPLVAREYQQMYMEPLYKNLM